MSKSSSNVQRADQAVRIALSIGANSGERERQILGAARLLDRGDRIRLLDLSSLYETEPVGSGFGASFINAACIAETSLDPDNLLERCKELERIFGRPAGMTGDRPLDIDIILYGMHVVDSPGLVIPHPAWRQRRFVLEPLAEIAPHLATPPDGETVARILASGDPEGWVRIVSGRRVEVRTS